MKYFHHHKQYQELYPNLQRKSGNHIYSQDRYNKQLKIRILNKSMDQQEIKSRHKKFNFTWDQFISRKRVLDNLVFDKYKILAKIGTGAFSTVYRGIIHDTKLEIAVKVINLREINAEKNQKLKQIKHRMAQSESRIIMQFNSPNILKCYETFENQDFKFMILQFCNGGSLYEKIEQMKTIPEDQSISILKQIINGIVECHKQKIIHRDLKPDNILIHNGVFKIADFGFSKTLQIKTQNQVCMNTTLGTMTTMAPQVVSRQPYGLKADIWSIGVIFFHMIFGQCPYLSTQDHARITQILSQKLVKQEFYKGIKPSQKVKKFILQVLVLEVEKRLGWREVVTHCIFEQEQEELRGSFNRRFELEQIGEQILRLERQLIMEHKKQQLVPGIIKLQQQKDQVLKPEHKLPQQNQKAEEREKYDVQKIQNQIKAEKLYKNPEQQKEANKVFVNPDFTYNFAQTQSEIVYPNQKAIKDKSIAQINEYQIRLVNDEQKQLFEWARHTHIECLKTEIIYKKIVKKIEEHSLIDLKSRQSIQLMYLLCTRCFNNMSPIKYQYSIYTKSDILKDLNDTVQNLYEQVDRKWKHYSSLLTRKQSQKMEVVSDWTKRKILSKLFPEQYKYAKKERFMTGIQSMLEFKSQLYWDDVQETIMEEQKMKHQRMNDQSIKEEHQLKGLQDYSKQQQIDYTVEYFQAVWASVSKKKRQELESVEKLLRNYKNICGVQLQNLTGKTFKSYIKELIQ